MQAIETDIQILHIFALIITFQRKVKQARRRVRRRQRRKSRKKRKRKRKKKKEIKGERKKINKNNFPSFSLPQMVSSNILKNFPI